MKRYLIILSIILLTVVSCAKRGIGVNGKEPFVRIALLHKVTNVEITSSGKFYIVSTNGKLSLSGGDKVNVGYARSGPDVTINKNKKVKTIYYPVKLKPSKDFLYVNNKPYRGEIWVIKDADNYLLVINVIGMEDYLKGVVPSEIGKLNENLIEASKAQAVAARTYAYSHINAHYDMGYDMECTVADQVYNGVYAEWEITNKAIECTAGVIATYNGIPIDAKYHSTCGGHTGNNEYAWGGSPVGYLRGVKDGSGCLFSRYDYCDNSPHYNWKHVFKRSDFFKLTSSNLSAMKGQDIQVKKVYVSKKERSGRIITLTMVDSKNRKWDLSGFEIRKVFEGVDAPGGFLRSRYFTITYKFTTVVLEGHGFGHGIGMCQYGAMDMARRGKKYQDILKHYYRGIKLEKLY